MEIELSIIIVNYNGGQLILNCIDSIYAELKSSVVYEIIVWDNCSTDQSADLIEERYRDIKLIRSEQNQGFGKGNNSAAKYANGKYLLFLNPDTFVKDKAIEILLKFAYKNPHAGAWGGVCELPDGSIDPGCRQVFPSLKRRLIDLFGLARHDFARLDRSRNFEGEVQVLSGAFMMVRNEIWEKIGGFDETFILYCEEVDICYRLNNENYSILMTGKSRILHDTSSGDPANPTRMLLMLRGTMHFFRKYYSLLGATTAAFLIWFYTLERFFVACILQALVRNEKYKTICQKFSKAALQPSKWWQGWISNNL